MENWLRENERLIFKHEVLRARLDIRDFFLKTTVREVYENIGQVLSLVRMQLAILDTTTNSAIDKNINASGNLVGQSIRDLRAMCRSFYPDAELLKENGLIEALENTIYILYKNANAVVKTKGIIKELHPELKLVVFKMLQEILTAIEETEGEFVSLVISYAKEAVRFIISYSGREIVLRGEISRDSLDSNLTLQERAKLINAKFEVAKNEVGVTVIKLITPLKLFYNE